MNNFPIYSSAPDDLAREVLRQSPPGTWQYILAAEYLALFDARSAEHESELVAEYDNGFEDGRTCGEDDMRKAITIAVASWAGENLREGRADWLLDVIRDAEPDS